MRAVGDGVRAAIPRSTGAKGAQASEHEEAAHVKYASLGNTGLVVSKLAFGSMTFGADDGSGVWKVGQEEANGLVARALDAGVTFFTDLCIDI